LKTTEKDNAAYLDQELLVTLLKMFDVVTFHINGNELRRLVIVFESKCELKDLKGLKDGSERG
jgi:hypothetical protein